MHLLTSFIPTFCYIQSLFNDFTNKNLNYETTLRLFRRKINEVFTFAIPLIAITTFCDTEQPVMVCISLFTGAFGNAARRNISYRSSCSSVKFDTRTLKNKELGPQENCYKCNLQHFFSFFLFDFFSI